MRNPDNDRDLNNSSGLSFGLGVDCSCGPQIASANGVTVVGAVGNLMNDCSSVFGAEWNAIPNVLVPLR